MVNPHPSHRSPVPGPSDSSVESSCGRRPSQSRRWMSWRTSVASIMHTTYALASTRRWRGSRRVDAGRVVTVITWPFVPLLDSRQPSHTEVPVRRIGLAVVVVLGLTFAPLAAAAQGPGKIAKIGVLAIPETDDPELSALWKAFVG